MHATPYLYRTYSMVELTYTMPAGKAILFPILSGNASMVQKKMMRRCTSVPLKVTSLESYLLLSIE
jgi:hypothetical protein